MASVSNYFQGDMGSHDPTSCSFQQFLEAGSSTADKAPAQPSASPPDNIPALSVAGTAQHSASDGSGVADRAPAAASAPADVHTNAELDVAKHLYLAQASIRSDAPGAAPLSALLQDIQIPTFLPQAPSEINLWMSMRCVGNNYQQCTTILPLACRESQQQRCIVKLAATLPRRHRQARKCTWFFLSKEASPFLAAAARTSMSDSNLHPC